MSDAVKEVMEQIRGDIPEATIEVIRRESEDLREEGLAPTERWVRLTSKYPDIPQRKIWFTIIRNTGECQGCLAEADKYKPTSCRICIRNPDWTPQTLDQLIQKGEINPPTGGGRYGLDQYTEWSGGKR